jgi:hypothetical protein
VVAATVEPLIVACDSGFGRTTFEENRLEVDLGWASPVAVSGPGAGAGPTAAALLSDLLRVSPAPNDRGSGVSAFTSVPDPRLHRWLVVGRLDPGSLATVAEATGICVTRLTADAAHSALLSGPATWNEIQLLITALKSINVVTAVARYEAGTKPGGLQ